MARYFGTDGIRGRATDAFFQPPFLRRLADAAVVFLQRKNPVDRPFHIVIGRDPRSSGERILHDLAVALAERNVQVLDAGVVPTPAVSRAVIDFECDLGMVITASHNPAEDNGIKLFGCTGSKLTEEDERVIEELLDAELKLERDAGATLFPSDARERYIEFAVSLLDEGALQGWRIAVDCAHGATAGTTPAVLRRLGAEVLTIGVEPDGENINCGLGSEHPEPLGELVRGSGARLGLAHDGDGDRLILVDETGAVVPGDCVLGLVGQHLARTGRLEGNTLVATVMSNLGLDRALSEVGARVLRTSVGDRAVFHAMLEGGYVFGGEASGHLIFRQALPTGDGLVSALMVIRILLSSGKRLSDLASAITLFPQRMVSRRVRRKIPLEELPELQEVLESISRSLASRGRILVRYSGTEPKIRLLAEAESEELAEETLAALEQAVGRAVSFE